MHAKDMITEPATDEMIAYCMNWCPILDKLPAPFVAGGFIRDFFIDKNPSDMDIYFRNASSLEIARKAVEQSGLYKQICYTDRALTYKRSDGSECPIQLIQYWFDEPVSILADFDFVVCMAGMDYIRRSFVHHPDFAKDLLRGRLTFNDRSGDFRLSSLSRLVKFVSRGYTISNDNLYKIAENIAKAGIGRVRQYHDQYCSPRPNDLDEGDETVQLRGGGSDDLMYG